MRNRKSVTLPNDDWFEGVHIGYPKPPEAARWLASS